MVESKIDDARGRLTRLIKYTSGDAKELIKHCIHRPAHEGYEDAKQLLKERYGNEYIILAAYKNDLHGGPNLRPDNSKDYQQFYTFLLKYKNIIANKSINTFNSLDILRIMVSKMPSNAQDRWTRKTLNIRKCQLEEPCLQHFLEFMKDKTLLVSDPVFSKEAMNCRSENDDRNPKRPSVKNNVKTFNVNIQDDTVRRKDDSLNCLRCNDSHHLDHCEKFITDTIEERVQFLTENALCYACCEPMTSWHNSRSCRKR